MSRNQHSSGRKEKFTPQNHRAFLFLDDRKRKESRERERERERNGKEREKGKGNRTKSLLTRQKGHDHDNASGEYKGLFGVNSDENF